MSGHLDMCLILGSKRSKLVPVGIGRLHSRLYPLNMFECNHFWQKREVSKCEGPGRVYNDSS